MANKWQKNLIPASERSLEEVRENGRKGGKASGEARRKRKALKDTMETLLSLEVRNTKDWNELSKMGFDPDAGYDNSMLIVLGLFKRARTGDVAAIKELRGMIGEGDDAAAVNTSRENASHLSTKELEALAKEYMREDTNPG